MNPSIAKFSEGLIQSTASEEPLSKVFQEVQLAKEGVVRVESGSLEETGNKVIKTEAGTSDNGLWNSSGQNTEKLAEPASIQKDAETRQSELRNQTMDQIVRKAAIHLRNGQHEARIELKPDFLGHIRMQVISENQQVTVKILAQHGFVKDMIESNVHQLKADLQQQGLEVDKLEVTVARDSDDSANYKDKLAQSKFRQSSANRHSEDRPTEEQPEKPRRSPLVENGSSSVDYFA
jgi:flagellar hook-length control protein FliK